MTLINYLTRIHFGDDILEAALWDELERNRVRRPLVIASSETLNSLIGERLLSGFPVRTDFETLSSFPAIPTEADARRIADRYSDTGRDHLISFGSAAATNLAKAVRILIGHRKPLASLALPDAGAKRPALALPDHYAIPADIDLASAIGGTVRVSKEAGGVAEIESDLLIPTVTICDPTLTLDTEAGAMASAGAAVFARCLEAFLSRGYNPPADGIALDGVVRAVANLHRAVREDGLAPRREMMAAGLNCALAQQKGFGLAHAMARALAPGAQEQPDAGAINRLVLPGVLRFIEETERQRFAPLRHILGVGAPDSLANSVHRFLENLPLPGRLAEMGIGEQHMERAAERAAQDRAAQNAPRTADPDDILSIMRSVQ
ncbi:iron-containing alcohol dehydrogenase [Nisaea sp.]|uniref:iron-containing alcohol dehydrogenase n=1 Tax=Nisaea sp. TaxID=2024842 RepID=UPI003B52701C